MFMIFPLLVLTIAVPLGIITMICDTNIFNNKYKRDNSTILRSIFMGNGLIGYMREKNIG
nr:MAG TPA: hypothetical protein [Caudoviricetes sp.]